MRNRGFQRLVLVLVMGFLASLVAEYGLIVFNPFVPEKASLRIQVEDLQAVKRITGEGQRAFYTVLVSFPARKGTVLLTARLYGTNISQAVLASPTRIVNFTTNTTIELQTGYPFILARLYLFPGRSARGEEALLEVVVEQK